MTCPKKAPAQKTADRAEIEAIRQKIISLVEEKPEKAATILRMWINGNQNLKKDK